MLGQYTHYLRRTAYYLRSPSEAFARARDALRPKKLAIRQIRVEGFSLLVMANEDVGWRLIVRDFEQREIEALRRVVRDDDVCIDVGANIGFYTVLMARLAARGSVVAIEPVELNRAFININTRLNDVANVTVLDGVLSDSQGQVSFSVASDGAYSSLRPTGRSPHLRELRVPARTLDSITDEMPGRIGVLKVDVEGAELAVLRGGSRLFGSARRPRAVMVELNADNQRVFDVTPAQVCDFMSTVGYKAHSLTEKGIVPGWPLPGAAENVLFTDDGAASGS